MSDKLYREWIQRQPSCLSGKFSEYVDGEGRCIAAHVRRAGKSGIAYKAEYSCVPMMNEEHLYQHQHGELRCIERFKPECVCRWDSLVREELVLFAKVWFSNQAELYYHRWLETLKTRDRAQLQEV